METVSFSQTNVQILEDIYYQVCEFMKVFSPIFRHDQLGKRRQRPFCSLSIEEIMTILISYQIIGAQSFKQFYKDIILQFHKKEFPNYVSYSRFVSVSPIALIPLCCFLKFRIEMSEKTQLYVVDSTVLRVCENPRIPRHRTFDGWAQRGKTGRGWFYGFKLHLIINHVGELMSFTISPGNLDDRKGLKKMLHELKGKLLGDKGYLSQELFSQLFSKGLELITPVRKNMKPKACSLLNKLLLRKRSVIETVNDLLKNFFQIEHSRHRSWSGFMINVLNSLIAYSFYPPKPHMRGVDIKEYQIMTLSMKNS